MRLATESIRLVSGMAETMPRRVAGSNPARGSNYDFACSQSRFLALNATNGVWFPPGKTTNALQELTVTAPTSSSHSHITTSSMTSLRNLSVLFLALALAVGTVSLVHAPPPSQPPVISTPIISPTSPTSDNIVTVSVNVTSARSTIKNVTITYTIDNWKSTNTTIVASYNATTTTATGKIPALASGGNVEYYIVAFDNSGNSNLNNNNGSYFAYNVPAPMSLTSISTLTYILVAAGIAAAVAIVAFKILKAPQGKSRQTKTSSTQIQDAAAALPTA